MVLIGEYHKEKIDGKEYLIYHNVEYPSQQTHSPNSSLKVVIDDLPLPPLFLCPSSREWEERTEEDQNLLWVLNSPLYDESCGHHILPLFWCDNKQADDQEDGVCGACKSAQVVPTSYYYCVECDKRYHKECVESPLEIHHPCHFKLSPQETHSLDLFFYKAKNHVCICCRSLIIEDTMIYYCTHCDCFNHIFCAKQPIPLSLHNKNVHNHNLALFPRQASLTCNVCALVNKLDLTYVCTECDFVSHSGCAKIPKTIRICRHDQHRISFVSSLPLEERICRVCHKEVDSDYGAYACNMCSDYTVHTKCALRIDLWDGVDLDGVPEEEYENVEPFERMDDGDVLHFLHRQHPLRLEVSEVYDENKFCQACGLSIHEGDFYSCLECDFILHEVCANAPRKKFSLVHPHKLNLELVTELTYCFCDGCDRNCTGFIYVCRTIDCKYTRGYNLCVRCALISEPFTYQGHQHPLFQSLLPEERPLCHLCKSTDALRVLSCIESDCDFVICFKCATLPFMVRYKHDDHPLTFCRGEEACVDSDWCELCEGKLAVGGEKGFYKCEDCCTTLHIHCLLGPQPYLLPGKVMLIASEFHILRNNSSTREICYSCSGRCPYPTFFACAFGFLCSIDCL